MFMITGFIPLISQAIGYLFGAVLDFEPRVIQYLVILGVMIGILICIEQLLLENHPTASGVVSIIRYVAGLIDVTVYYLLLLNVAISVPGIIHSFGPDPSGNLTIYFYFSNNNVIFSVYLATLGLLIYAGYCINFFRYMYQMAAGYRLTEE